jgi:unsaturated rhamnogalacturonyl hydrolase
MIQPIRRMMVLTVLATGLAHPLHAQLTEAERSPIVGDAPADPGPLAHGLSPALAPTAVQAVMRKVADWQVARVADTPSQDWTFATLYVGLLSASDTLHDDRYREVVQHVADHFQWKLGPRTAHADDQAIGQAYLILNRRNPAPDHLAPMRLQFDQLMASPDDPAKPVWWWCDALFMAPPVWTQLAAETGDPAYLAYMEHEWQITSSSLSNPQEQLFYRDAGYFDKREKNGRKVFWSRGNGWVMGGMVRVLETLPTNDPMRPFYIDKLQKMAASVSRLQGPDGLWRAGLLDAKDYALPETSGSAFFVYALAWGIDHRLLDRQRYLPVVQRGWAGLVAHVYESGRLGCVQPVGEKPGNYAASASSVFGVGALLLAGSEVSHMAAPATTTKPRR